MSRISFIVLANSQRAGSTLVQRILNQRRNLFVWGERGDFLPNFADTEQEALLFSADSAALREVYLPLKSTHGVSLDALKRMQNLSPDGATIRAATEAGLREYGRVFHRLPAYDEVGFKVVRATGRDVDLCCRAWPDAVKLLVFREPGAVYCSLPKTWRDAHNISPEVFSNQWIESACQFLEYSHSRKNCYLIDYDGLVRGGRSRSRLLLLADLELHEIESVLAFRLNPTLAQERASEEAVSKVRARCYETYKNIRHFSELIEEHTPPP